MRISNSELDKQRAQHELRDSRNVFITGEMNSSGSENGQDETALKT